MFERSLKKSLSSYFLIINKGHLIVFVYNANEIVVCDHKQWIKYLKVLMHKLKQATGKRKRA